MKQFCPECGEFGNLSLNLSLNYDFKIIKTNIKVPKEKLTSQQLKVASLMCFGLTNTKISEILVIDIRTVEFHINNIYKTYNLFKTNTINLRVTFILNYIQELGLKIHD